MPTIAEIITAGTAARQNQRQFEEEMDFRANQAAQANTFGLLNTIIGAQLQKDAMLEAEKLRGASLMDLEKLTQQGRLELVKERGAQDQLLEKLRHELSQIAGDREFYRQAVATQITDFLKILDQSAAIPVAIRAEIGGVLSSMTDSIATELANVMRVLIQATTTEQQTRQASAMNTAVAAAEGVNVSKVDEVVIKGFRSAGEEAAQLAPTTIGYADVARYLTAKPVAAAIRELKHQNSFFFGQPDDRLGLLSQADMFLRLMQQYAPDSMSVRNAKVVRLIAADAMGDGDPVTPDLLQDNEISPHTLTMIRQEWDAFFERLRDDEEVAKMPDVRDQLIGDPAQNFRRLHPGKQRGDLPSVVSHRLRQLGGTVDLTGIIKAEVLQALKQPSDGKPYNAALFRQIVNSGFAANAPEIAHDLGQKYGPEVGARVASQLEQRDPTAAEQRRIYDDKLRENVDSYNRGESANNKLREDVKSLAQSVTESRTELADVSRDISVKTYLDGVRAAERAVITRAVSRLNGILMQGAAFNQPQVSADIVRAMQETLRPLEDRYRQRWGVSWHEDPVGDARDTVEVYARHTQGLMEIVKKLSEQQMTARMLPGGDQPVPQGPPTPTTQPVPQGSPTPMTQPVPQRSSTPITQPALPAPQAAPRVQQPPPRHDPFAGPLAAYGLGVQPTDRIMNPLGLPPTTQPAGGM